MIFKKNRKTDWDLERLTDEQLSQLPLAELQRIRNKRWAHDLEELKQRAEQELKRRDPRSNWACQKCGKTTYHQKEVRVSGGLTSSWLNVETNKFHVVICNYCGNSEFYSVLKDGPMLLDIMGG
ncbi:MAG: zinc ribbon domain-containing protein [Candidatus Sedimenticola sp. (ex Thyasira tokunagai)]